MSDSDDLCGHLVVDGANVVGARPDGWWRDRVGAATRLAAGLDALASAHPELVVTLMVEGRARDVDDDAAPAVEIVRAPASGDDTLVEVVSELVARGAAPVVAVTSDRELVDRVHDAGANVRGASWLWNVLDEAARH